MTDQTLSFLRMHECSRGLSDEAIAEIASHAEIVRCQTGEYLHRAFNPVSSIYLVVQGRLRQSMVDTRGNVFLCREITRGHYFGLLAAAQDEPVPVDVVAEEPSTLLKLDYLEARELARKHEKFGSNLVAMISDTVRELITPKKSARRPSVVAVIHQTPATRPLTPRLVARLVELGESPGVLSDITTWEGANDVSHHPLTDHEGPLSEEDIHQRLAHWSDSRRVLIDVDAAIDRETIRHLLEICDKVFWCVRPGDWPAAAERLNAVDVQSAGWRQEIAVVWLLGDGEQVRPAVTGLDDLAVRDFKVSFSKPKQPHGAVLNGGLERIVHELRGIRIGLALGGGAARGMAHLGVLKALERSGITIDMIAGTSAGAMTGTLYAAGVDVDFCIEQFMANLRPPLLFRLIPRGDQWYLLYKYRRGHFDSMLRQFLYDWSLDQLAIPMHAVTVDLISGQAVVRDRGDATHAIVESINLPVLSTPICRDGRALVDGGLVNNVPADVLVSKGCNFVIAVSVTAKVEQSFAKNCPDTPTADMKSASTLQTILRSYVVQSMNMNSIGVQPADIVIEPDVTAFDLTEFSRADELAAVGEQATLETLPGIKELLTQLDSELFPAQT